MKLTQCTNRTQTNMSFNCCLALKLLNKQAELLQVGKAARMSLFQGCFSHKVADSVDQRSECTFCAV